MLKAKPKDHNLHENPGFISKLEKLDIKLDVKKFPKNFLASFTGKACLYCRSNEDNEAKFGKFVHHARSGISIHYFCLLFASGLQQLCKDSDCDKTRTPKSIYGFYIADIVEEFKRGSRLKCTICHTNGATIGCSVMKCRARYHFSCAYNHQALFQYYGCFKSFCRKHKPTQLELFNSKEHKEHSSGTSCCMCFEELDLKNGNNLLISPCCKETIFHRECVQKQALSSGLFYFRCPACNNKDDYTNEMLRMGIYIPDRDASWETPEAFSDLLENHVQCDTVECQCRHGRKHDSPQTLWEIVVCLFCGCSGTHVACSSLENASSPFVCEICTKVYGRSGVRKTLLSMGFNPNQLICNENKIDHLKEIDTNQQRPRRSLKRKAVDEILENRVMTPRRRKLK